MSSGLRYAQCCSPFDCPLWLYRLTALWYRSRWYMPCFPELPRFEGVGGSPKDYSARRRQPADPSGNHRRLRRSLGLKRRPTYSGLLWIANIERISCNSGEGVAENSSMDANIRTRFPGRNQHDIGHLVAWIQRDAVLPSDLKPFQKTIPEMHWAHCRNCDGLGRQESYHSRSTK